MNDKGLELYLTARWMENLDNLRNKKQGSAYALRTESYS